VEAGIAIDWLDDGARINIRDANPDASAIRNRGGEGIAKLVSGQRQIRALDMRESRISDNGVGHLSLILRQTDQLEELYLSPCGQVGLEFIIGIVNRCTRLHTLHLEVVDETTKQRVAKNLTGADFDTSAYVKPEKKEGEEESEGEEGLDEPPPEDEDEAAKLENEKMEKLRKLFSENDGDSDNEDGRVCAGGKPPGAAKGTSPELHRLLRSFVEAVARKENLLHVQCKGAMVPSDISLDLQRLIEDHQALQAKRAAAREERGARTAFDALKDQLGELKATLESESEPSVQDMLSGGDSQNSTRLGVRSLVNRRLFAALGEALFECQRFKSKENEAVSTAQGEMAFISMYMRKHALDAK
jgi:hypothetical protein